MKLSYSAFLASSAWTHQDRTVLDCFQAKLDTQYGKITIITAAGTEEQIPRCEVKLISNHSNGNLNRLIYVWRDQRRNSAGALISNDQFSCYFLSNSSLAALLETKNGFYAVNGMTENHESERYVHIKDLFDFEFNADLARIASATKTPIADLIPKSKLK